MPGNGIINLTISWGQERKARYLLTKPGINPSLGFLINILVISLKYRTFYSVLMANIGHCCWGKADPWHGGLSSLLERRGNKGWDQEWGTAPSRAGTARACCSWKRHCVRNSNSTGCYHPHGLKTRKAHHPRNHLLIQTWKWVIKLTGNIALPCIFLLLKPSCSLAVATGYQHSHSRSLMKSRSLPPGYFPLSWKIAS